MNDTDIAVKNEHAEAIIVGHRYRKAYKLAELLLGQGVSASEARSVGHVAYVRDLAGKAADVNAPSVITWALVVAIMERIRP